MENVGQWNSNVALFYLFLFLLPCLLKILGWIIEAMPSTVQYVPVEVEKTVYKDRPVYKDRTIYKEKVVYKNRSTPKKKQTPKQKDEKPAVCPYIDTVASTLVSLGCKKKEAKVIVSQVASQKTYKDDESLLKDCLAKL